MVTNNSMQTAGSQAVSDKRQEARIALAAHLMRGNGSRDSIKYLPLPYAQLVRLALEVGPDNLTTDLITARMGRVGDAVIAAANMVSASTIVMTAPEAVSHLGVLHAATIAVDGFEAAANASAEARSVSDIRDILNDALRALPGEVLADSKPLGLKTLSEDEIDDTKSLIQGVGQPWLSRAEGVVMTGPAGVGKSTLSMQQDMLWSLGLPCLGMVPIKPLKIVTIQAENPVNMLRFTARRLRESLELDAAKMDIVDENVKYYWRDDISGDQVLDFVSEVAKGFDIVRIDPLMAYLGTDVVDNSAARDFLRLRLQPLLHRLDIACILMHHTPKITNRDTSKWGIYEWAYAALGASEITNWARATLALEPSDPEHPEAFILASGKKTPWPENPRQIKRLSGERVLWADMTTDEANTAKASRSGRKQTSQSIKALGPQAMMSIRAALDQLERDGIPATQTVIADDLVDTLSIGRSRSHEVVKYLVDIGQLAATKLPGRGNPTVISIPDTDLQITPPSDVNSSESNDDDFEALPSNVLSAGQMRTNRGQIADKSA